MKKIKHDDSGGSMIVAAVLTLIIGLGIAAIFDLYLKPTIDHRHAQQRADGLVEIGNEIKAEHFASAAREE